MEKQTQVSIMIISNNPYINVLGTTLNGIVINCLNDDNLTCGHYWLEEIDEDELLDLLNEIKENKNGEFTEEFIEAFEKAYDDGDAIYMFYNELGEFQQPLGFVLDIFED